MGSVVLEITMSLDGYIAGPDIDSTHPLGKGGLRLHDWIFGGETEADRAVMNASVSAAGAVILGRRTYDTAIDGAWGGESPFAFPAYVLSQESPESGAPAGFTFITDGIERALQEAQSTAGDRDVWIMGGAATAQQFIKAGLLDELHIHIAPVLFCAGTRLFEHIGCEPIELEPVRVIQTRAAVHSRFRFVRNLPNASEGKRSACGHSS